MYYNKNGLPTPKPEWIESIARDYRAAARPIKRRRFCNRNCYDGWVSDRNHGLIYPAWMWTNEATGEQVFVSHIESCRLSRVCPYCRADV